METGHLKVLQAAARVLSQRRPDQNCITLLNEYATVHLPERIGLPPDELATIVAMKLLDIPGDLNS